MEKIIRRGEVYWATLGDTAGSEQGGTRPVVIIQNNIGNKYSPVTIIAPLTTKIHTKHHIPTNVYLQPDELGRECAVHCEQIRAISKNRLGDYIATLSDERMKDIDNALKISLNLV